MSEQNDNIDNIQHSLREQQDADVAEVNKVFKQRLLSFLRKPFPSAAFNVMMFGFAFAWIETVLGAKIYESYPDSTSVHVVWTIVCLVLGLVLYFGGRWLWFKQTGPEVVEKAAQKHSQEFIDNIYRSLLSGTPEEQRVALIILDVIDPSPKK